MGSVSGPNSPSESLSQDHDALPQYGFGPDVAFKKLVDSNPFLFRVHTPKESSPFYDRTEPYFSGQLFDDKVSSGNFLRDSASPSPYRTPTQSTYADVAQYMNWTTRSSSPYVSTSFSFAWAIWEATRRYHHGVKHAVEIAIIDAKAVASRAVTAVELLRQGDPKDRHKDHWKWYRFALEAQDVLVWGFIPGTAVLASVPLIQILTKLPSYFLSPDPAAKESPLSQLGWDYIRKKPSYRQFCEDMQERFLRLSIDRRMRDTTTGATRLAVSFLRPYFHKLVLDDFTYATVTVCDLAFVIARWPGLGWVREHPEIRDLIRGMVHIVGEEMREASKVQELADANRMQDIMGGLEHLAKTYQAKHQCHRYLTTPSVTTIGTPTENEEVAPLDIAEVISETASQAELEPEPEPKSMIDLTTSATSVTATTNAMTITEKETVPMTAKEVAEKQGSRSILGSSSALSLESLVMTASCILTGFFFGTFVTLAMLSSHRREIANHFT
ncbi:hypothetical protein BKA93DRAFT_793571 [Sparassis latifolia]|uniref:DUF7587 domain-containing protein n=1 Tax=Sparassis crispa TaxID=139825 RepID=A0A401H5U2_9APHY|nr:hypothetical protein SCP_1701300 [Sparassis crispa]GBE89805.1 hypothetical protein SCP_1701300 [Sparassis crispa]